MGILNLFNRNKKEIDFSNYSAETRQRFESQQRQTELDAMLKAKEQQLAENPIQTQYVSFSPKIQNKREMNIAKRKANLEVIKRKQENWKVKEELRKVRMQIQLEGMQPKNNSIKPYRLSSHPIY
jgi:hypothetical protein